MAIVTAILGAIPTLLKIIMMVIEAMKKSPKEKRRQVLAELDSAFKKAKETKDVRDLSKWLGKRL